MRSISIVIVFTVLLSLCAHSTVSAPSPSASTVVRFDPANVVLGYINETFTLAARIDNVEDLAGLGLTIVWNTTYLKYIGHTVTIPVEEYPNGIMHNPTIVEIDGVNEMQGTYDCVASRLGAPTFNGSGTVFEITFAVKQQPVSPKLDATFMIEYILHDLTGPVMPIQHSVQDCNVTIKALWNPADVNDDLKVDIVDVMLCANSYQATPSEPHWNPRCDLATPYDLINIFDIVTIVASYGEEYPS